MNPARLDENYDKTLYPKKDYHTLYFGEIVACYETDEPEALGNPGQDR